MRSSASAERLDEVCISCAFISSLCVRMYHIVHFSLSLFRSLSVSLSLSHTHTHTYTHTHTHTHTQTHTHKHTHTHTHTQSLTGADSVRDTIRTRRGDAVPVLRRGGRRHCRCPESQQKKPFRPDAAACWSGRDAGGESDGGGGNDELVTNLCWRMLAYAGVCWRMLAYADVCWRMPTYAAV